MNVGNVILDVKKLSNSFEGNPFLRDINFSLESGEILCLLGPSGSGKTSLLRILAGLEQVETGGVRFLGRDMVNVPSYRRNFGMMFQEYALFPHRNVYDNIVFGLEMKKWRKEEQRQRVYEMLRLVGLEDFEQRNTEELSGGERQRVALARSLAPQPRLLLLDEPLGSLDRALRERLTGEIRTILKKLGVTAVFVTHDQEEAFTIADRVAVLFNGRLVQIDCPEQLYNRPADSGVAAFLGFKNLVDGVLDENSVFTCSMGSFSIEGSGADRGSKGKLLIKPEAAIAAGNGDTEEKSGYVLAGRVTLRQFLGGRYKLGIQVGEEQLLFEVPDDPRPPDIGQDVRLRVRKEGLVFLNS